MLQSAPQPVSLLPKEHGAYAMLLIPLVTSLLTGGLTLIGIAIAVAVVAGFLAHEPMLVARGHRGQRAQTGTPNARKQLFLWLLLAMVTGSVVFYLGATQVRIAWAICLIFAVVSFGMSAAGLHRKTAVHLWGMIGLSLPCISILLAGGESVGQALSFWGVWILGFAATTLGVRGMMANQKNRSRQLHLLALTILTLAIGIGSARGCMWPLATLPMIGVSWYLLISPPPLKQLKRVGWVMVIGTLTTAFLIVARAS